MGGLSDSTAQPNENTIRISTCTAIVMTVAWIAVILCWLWYAWVNIPDPYRYTYENLANVISALASFTILIYGYKITNEGAFNKGGTIWYPKNYSMIRVDIITREVRKKYEDSRSKIQDVIRVLTNDGRGGFDTPYFKYIYRLQDDDDFTFNMAWNNLNYFAGVKHKSRCVYRHYKKVEFYIFSRVYEKYMEEQGRHGQP